MGIYATSTDVKTFLRTAKNIIDLGNASSDDLSSTDLDYHIDLTDYMINAKLRKAYILTNSSLTLSNTDTANLMKDISIKLSSYNVYSNLFPATADADLPFNVKYWKESAMDVLDQIIKYELPLDGETTNRVTQAPYIPTREPVFDGIGINQANNQFNDEVEENNSDGDLE